jgi:hypothetical protein
MNFGKTISKQHQNVTGVIVENAESCTVHGLFRNSCGRDEKRRSNEEERQKQ